MINHYLAVFIKCDPGCATRDLHARLAELKNVVRRGKKVSDREVQICVRKLAANAGDCAIFKSAALPL